MAENMEFDVKKFRRKLKRMAEEIKKSQNEFNGSGECGINPSPS